VTAEMLTASLQTISQTAKRIISAIDGDGRRIEYEDGNVSPSSVATYPAASDQTGA
jgi:hypothetical protein